MKFAMQYSLGQPALTRRDAEEFMEFIRIADSYGLFAIGTGDTSHRLAEACTRVTMMALASERAYVGMRPTNPWTRDPQVMAGFLASIDSITGGRAFMEIATGDSAVYSTGHKAASRARVEEYVTCVRKLLSVGDGTYGGRRKHVTGVPRNPVRISICAEGPKMLALGGRLGDAVSIGMGLTSEVIREASSLVRAGAEQANREDDVPEIWFTCRCDISEDRDAARKRVTASLASILHHSMRFGLDGKFVPEEYHEPIRQFVDQYVLDEHQTIGGHNERLMSELGLADFAFERWALAGDAEDWIDRIETISARGATNLWIANRGTIEEMKHSLTLFGERVLPHFC